MLDYELEYTAAKENEQDLNYLLINAVILKVKTDENAGTISLFVSTDSEVEVITFGSRQDDAICYIEKLNT